MLTVRVDDTDCEGSIDNDDDISSDDDTDTRKLDSDVSHSPLILHHARTHTRAYTQHFLCVSSGNTFSGHFLWTRELETCSSSGCVTQKGIP